MLRPNPPPSKYHKVYVFGLRKSGKTCILDQLTRGLSPGYVMPREHEPTIEDIYSAVIDNTKGGFERVHFFETPGLASIQHFNVDFIKGYLPYADAIVMVYAINSKESFSIVELIKRTVGQFKEKKDIPIICLGNKLDRFRERQVDTDELTKWGAKERIQVFEVTATERKTLLHPMVTLASMLNPPQAKSAFPRLGPKGRTASSIGLEL